MDCTLVGNLLNPKRKTQNWVLLPKIGLDTWGKPLIGMGLMLLPPLPFHYLGWPQRSHHNFVPSFRPFILIRPGKLASICIRTDSLVFSEACEMPQVGDRWTIWHGGFSNQPGPRPNRQLIDFHCRVPIPRTNLAQFEFLMTPSKPPLRFRWRLYGESIAVSRSRNKCRPNANLPRLRLAIPAQTRYNKV
jgi:hypothetical protein